MPPPTFGVATGGPYGVYTELAEAAIAAAQECGWTARSVTDLAAARDLDLVIEVGFPDHVPWFATPIPGRRAAWLGEPLPPTSDGVVARVRRALPMGRVLDGAIAVATIGHRRAVPIGLLDRRELASSERDYRFNLADHRRAAGQGIHMIVTTPDRAATLRPWGIEAMAVPFGYHPAFAGPAQDVDDARRDIDVLVFGTVLTDRRVRRARILEQVLRDLGPTVRTEQVSSGLWGLDRARLLGRAKVVLNVNRVAGNFTGIRSVMVGASGAAYVSDPVDFPAPFIPGVHYVEAPPADLSAVIRTLLADRPRRLEMATAMQHFLVEDLTMARSLESILRVLG